MNILILGSCVTRDAFDIGNYKNDKLNHIHYFARCSLISLNSPPFNISLNEISSTNPFQQRLIANELNREFYTHINGRNIDNTYLIIDFADERLDLLIHEDKYITYSQEFENSNLSKTMTGAKVLRTESLIDNEWKKSCLLFIEKIKIIFPPEKVILHLALGKENFLDHNENHRFENIEQIRETNRLLSILYDFFSLHFPGIQVIDINNAGYQADKNHKWGLCPFHYSNDYYVRFLEELDHILYKDNKQI